MTYYTFLKLREKYWILDSYDKDESEALELSRAYQWVFSLVKPKPVPNKNMYWRRPTYSDSLVRQDVYEDNPSHFFSRCEFYSKN